MGDLQKSKYAKQAERDQMRYAREMENYDPPIYGEEPKVSTASLCLARHPPNWAAVLPSHFPETHVQGGLGQWWRAEAEGFGGVLGRGRPATPRVASSQSSERDRPAPFSFPPPPAPAASSSASSSLPLPRPAIALNKP
jgi:hypothetical protein